MFFYISKILQFLSNPITWVFILLIIALFQKTSKRKNRLLLTGLLVFYFFSNSFIFTEIARLWEVPAKKYEEIGKYELGIVLGGATTYDAALERMQANNSIDRILQAVELYHKGHIGKILFTGGSGSLIYPEMKEGIFVRDYLLTIGFPEESLIIESESKNTRENAVFTKELLEQNDWWHNQDFLLITSGYHMRRSVKIFEKIDMNPESYSVNRFAGKRRYDFEFLFLPNADVFKNWEAIIHEWFGMMVYYFAGYI
ncbi:MAG: YdcF family protein [Bacteroidetes bacterium]|nr:YdcF family protein [Bacteroidota bacterium]